MDGVLLNPKVNKLPSDQDSLKSKVIPYVLYFLLVTVALLHEWYGGRDPQAISWLKFAARNREVIVTNVIVDSHPTEPSNAFVAVEIVGSKNGEKKAISSQTSQFVKLSFRPQVGEKLALVIKRGQVHVTKPGDFPQAE